MFNQYILNSFCEHFNKENLIKPNKDSVLVYEEPITTKTHAICQSTLKLKGLFPDQQSYGGQGWLCPLDFTEACATAYSSCCR